MEIIKDIIIPCIAVILSIASIIISKRSELLSRGEIEFNIATLIRDAQYRVSDIGLVVAKHKSEVMKSIINREQLTQEELEEKLEEILEKDMEYTVLETSFNQSIEIMLNAYEESCAKYLDKKVDQERFKRSYHRAIREIVEDEDLKEEFNSHVTPYKCILKVYNQWYNLEV